MDFILRTRNKLSGEELNTPIGERYKFVHKEWSLEAFENHLGKDDNADLYGFIVDDKGVTHLLSKSDWNYVMTGKGQTFANVTYEPIKQ